MDRVYENGLRQVSYGYNANSQLIRRDIYVGGNALTVRTAYTVNLAGLVTQVATTNRNTNAQISSYTKTLYLDGNVQQLVEAVVGSATRTITYTYDAARRLTREHDTGPGVGPGGGTGTITRQYSFDNRGNRSMMMVSGSESYTVQYVYDLNNRLLTEVRVGQGAQSSTYTYDRNGNQLTRVTTGTGAVTETNTYNAFNMLIRVTRPGMTADYRYRTDGLRLSKTVNGTRTTHIWVRGNIVLERNTSGAVINRYIRNSRGQLIRSQMHGWYVFNARGDVTQRIYNNAGLLRAYRYSAFGNELNPDVNNNNPWRFAGEYWDFETNTYYLRARHFNPRTGRFTQPDPFWGIHNMQFGSNPVMRNGRPMPSIHSILQSGNLFMYTMHNPVRFTDPTGLWTKDIHEELTRLALELIGSDSGMEDLFASFIDFIVAGNLYIDIYHGAAALGFGFGDRQSRHFNRNSASAIDSRLVWAEYYLTAAINMWQMADTLSVDNWFTPQDRHNMQMDALFLLGRGLHSIQDMEAHGNIGMGWRGHFFAVHVDPRTDSRYYDWSSNSRRWVTSSTEQLRFNTSLNDSVNFLNRFFTSVGLS